MEVGPAKPAKASATQLSLQPTSTTRQSVHMPSAEERITNWTIAGGRWTDDGDFSSVAGWIGSEGHWGISAHVTNNSVWNRHYCMTAQFGHSNPDGTGFVAYYTTPMTNTTQMSGHGSQGDISATSGPSTVDVLRDNFGATNSIICTVHEDECP